ncbi:Redox-sensing transcriptional repressor Rex [bioreactor metagenome]|uniref:Redox-sensing transcriptional repressor Rex n=1 Tax=bioreactor metagenome TaxID=1076179 RepID=A0A645CFQ2_9ZZZZ
MGYDVGRLITLISDHLVGPATRPFLIVGMGKLGTAMAGFTGYPERGFRIAGLIDVAPDRVGTKMRVATTIGPTSLVIHHLDDLPAVVAGTGAGIALLCVPPRAAQDTLERLAAVGVTNILSFVSEGVHAPEGVRLRDVDLGRELQILAYYQQHPDTTTPPADAAEGQGTSTQKKVSV